MAMVNFLDGTGKINQFPTEDNPPQKVYIVFEGPYKVKGVVSKHEYGMKIKEHWKNREEEGLEIYVLGYDLDVVWGV